MKTTCDKVDAGILRDRVGVLRLQLDEISNSYEWTRIRSIAAEAEVSGKSNLFSRVGIGARDVVFTVRHRDDLTCADALSWRGPAGWEHCFITEITPLDRLFDRVRCARVRLVDCVAEANHTPHGPEFPAVLTEKYVGHEQLEPLAVNVITYVLVTPKAVELKRGSIVEVGGVPYEVQVGHLLDEWKNEFEIVRTVDL